MANKKWISQSAKRVFLLIMVGLINVSLGFSAEIKSSKEPIQSSQDSKSQPIITYAPGPPPGFGAALLAQKQTTYLSVFYGDIFLGNFLATFTDKWVKFAHPAQLVKQVPSVLNPENVIQSLSQKLPIHQDNLCAGSVSRGEARLCKALSPAVVGVVVDVNSYKAYLFINPKLLTLQALKGRKLRPSTAGLSVATQATTNFNLTDNSKTINLVARTQIGYKNNRFSLQANLAHSQFNGSEGFTGLTDSTSLNIGQFTYGLIQRDKLFQAGVMSTIGSQFITSEQILGVSAQNSYVSYDNRSSFLSQNAGTPLYVDLTLPSQVNVYSGTTLLYSTSLGIGRHQLDTSLLPVGSYMVTIKVTNNIGQTSTTTQLYVKQSQLTGDGDLYYFMLGFLSKNNSLYGQTAMSGQNSSFTASVPYFNSHPVANFYEIRPLSHYLTLSTNWLSDFKDAYGEFSLNWYPSQSFSISPDLLLSNAGYNGGQLAFNIQTPGGLVAYLTAQKMFVSGQAQSLVNNSYLSGSFNPVTPIKWSLNSNLSYGFPSTNTQITFGYSRQEGFGNVGISGNYSLSLTQQLFQSSLITGNFNIGLTHSSNDTMLSASLNLNLMTVNQLFVSGQFGFARNKTAIGNGETETNNQPTTTLNATKTINFGAANSHNVNQLQLGTSYFNQQGNETYGVNLNYQNPALSASVQYTNNQSSTYSNYNVSGSLQTGIYYSGGQFAWGYGINQWFSGVMIRLQSPVPAQADVIVNGVQLAHVSTNSPRVLFLMPFKTYRISIVPTGNQLLSYDPFPKTVTLYQGNMQTLTWQLGRQYLLFAQIVDEKGKPLQNWLLKSRGEFDTTDETGFLQASISTRMHTMTFKSIENKTCEVTLPAHVDIKQQVAVIKEPLVCKPIPA